MEFAQKKETRTTTVRLPRSVYDQVICVVEKEKGVSGSASLNDFFVAAIEAYLRMYRRRQIDAAFAGMAEDTDYQKEAKLIAEEFEHSDKGFNCPLRAGTSHKQDSIERATWCLR